MSSEVEKEAVPREDACPCCGGSGLYGDAARRAIDGEGACARQTPEKIWHPVSELPDVGRKFIALYDDGSGALMAWRHDGGFIDQEGEEFDVLKNFDRWSYLPNDLEFWCEVRAEDPMTLYLPSANEQRVEKGEGR